MHPGKFSLVPKKEVKDTTVSCFPSYNHSTSLDPIDVSSSSPDVEGNALPHGNLSNQLVLYDPVANENNSIQLLPDPLQCEPPLIPTTKPSDSVPRVLPSVGAFTVQCASCFKWRLIPTKEKYEEIREHILQHPFVCQKAREWRPDVSCDDPEDISQDGSRIWAIDKPSIAQPPPGWQRLLRIRGEGSTKFADVYYVAPSGKRLRSMVEIQKFSFQIPRPLQENYVRKRPARLTSPYEVSGPVEPEQVSPLAWAGPEESPISQTERLRFPAPCMQSHAFDPISRPAKKQATQSSFQNGALQ
ncbi:methyl-CpG-binding domain-containing protein 2-like isoform X2 [Abrus precatorius]|uniref:Methyl-CpG-binding domain-containing protein 2-like isoform X2 n=1 Tax=Abrus precatorius TaxID=3816 RepID=A0A8B8LVG9_ABRPR|nr:methyl-CpG-binding domain-containing protein 2-like isoform X2 [Abrus precatorius]